MTVKNRRAFLKTCAAALPALGFSRTLAGEAQSGASAQAPGLVRFIDPLPALQRLRPEAVHPKGAQYRVTMVEFQQHLHSQLPPTRLWGYEGHYPGPVFEAQSNQLVEVEWKNQLPARHLFAIDPHIHGAMPPTPAVRTVPHLHGARAPYISDGLPENWFTPGGSVLYRYLNQQPAATLWYHDHAMGITRLNAYAGLSGMYLLRDAAERSLGLPEGEYEVPLVLQDRTLDEHGQLVYAAANDAGQPMPNGVWGPHLFGELPVVNGAIYPYLEVEPRPYRLRVLNAANSRFFHLYLNLAKSPTDIPSLVSFHQIGTDGGLLPQPAALRKLLLAPAERADLVLDFSGLEGKTVTLSNDAPSPYPGWNMLGMVFPALPELMQFRVTRPLAPAARTFSLPPAIALARIDPKEAVRTRDFVLSEQLDAQGNSLGMFINGKRYRDPVTETVQLGTVERWRFINTSDDAHPMHLHLVQFQILERQGFDPGAIERGEIHLIGEVRPPAPNEAGWKDTAVVNPRDVLTILVRFEGYTGRYVYHCHMLEHEDNDMMRPFEVVAEQKAPPLA